MKIILLGALLGCCCGGFAAAVDRIAKIAERSARTPAMLVINQQIPQQPTTALSSADRMRLVLGQ